VAGTHPLDIAEIEGGSIEADLGRRDFTINAIAVSLPDGGIVDPFGGLKDLRRRRLSCVATENLRADPLRALRAARFYATHGLRPDRATLGAARAAAPEMHRVAVERIETELSKLLASRAAAPALEWVAAADLLPAALGRNLTPARAARLARSLRCLDDPATRRLLPEARRRLRLAHLAVHLGFTEPETRRWLRDRRFARNEADDVATLVALAGGAGAPRGRMDQWRWVLRAGPLATEAARLLASLQPAERRRALGLARLARAPRCRVAVTGTDVMRWLNLPPGPAVGALLSELAVQAASGAVKNRREARHWLSGQERNHPSPAIIAGH
jgi:tRNA nucleotidyltransferase/poly(A) polymerase